MFNNFSNHVKIAVDRLGGPTRAAHSAGVSNATIHAWIKKRRIPDIKKASAMAVASGIEVRLLRSTR